jgi:hypothetical protein
MREWTIISRFLRKKEPPHEADHVTFITRGSHQRSSEGHVSWVNSRRDTSIKQRCSYSLGEGARHHYAEVQSRLPSSEGTSVDHCGKPSPDVEPQVPVSAACINGIALLAFAGPRGASIDSQLLLPIADMPRCNSSPLNTSAVKLSTTCN